MKARSLLVLALFCGGVAAQEKPGAAVQREADEIGEFCKNVLNGSALDPIRARIPVLKGLAQPTPEMLADRSKATDAERPAILALDAGVVECANRRMTYYLKYGGLEHAAATRSAVVQAQKDRIDLYRGAITFGEYVAFNKAVVDALNQSLAAAAQRQREMSPQQRADLAKSTSGAAVAPLRPIDCSGTTCR